MKYFSEKALEKKIEAIGGGGKTYSAGAGLDLNDTVFSIKDSVLAEIAKISDWFELKDGNIHVRNNRGFWSDSFISAGGLSSGGGAAAGNATLSNVTTTGATISADGVGSIDVYSKGYLDTALAQAGKVQSVVGQTGAVTAAQIGSALISEGYELTDHTYTNGTGLSLVGGEFSISTGYQAKIQSGEDAYADLHNWFERKNVGTEANPIWAIHVKSDMGFYSDSFVSAGGISPGGGTSAGNATLVAQTYGGTLSATGIDEINFYSKERVDQLLLTAGKVQTVAGVAPTTSGDIPVASLKSALGLGAAAAYGIGSVASGNTGLVTGGSVYSAINEAVSSVMKMQGTTTTPLSDGSTTNPVVIDGSSYTAKKGDVVLYDGKEYLWAGSAWEQLGDEASWALKTTTISAGTGLEGGGTLASNRTISISPTYQTYISNGNTAYGWGDWRTRVGTLETNLTALTTRVTTLEGRTNWDTYFGVDENGDIYVKKNGDTARNFYSWGAVSAGCLSDGGGSGGIDPTAMWQLLGSPTNEQIAASHLTTALRGYLPLTGGTMSNTNLVTNLNADLLDGLNESSFVANNRGVLTDFNIVYGSSAHFIDPNYTNGPSGVEYGQALVLHADGDTTAQLVFPCSRTTAFLRVGKENGSVWQSWREFAFLDSNVASATRLQTPRLIWGQSFDGAGNVTGAMSGVTNIDSLLYFDTTNSELRMPPYATIGWFYTGTDTGAAPYITREDGSYSDETKGDMTFSAGKWTSTNITAFKFGTVGTNYALVIKNNGNVGIGTTSPSYTLDVTGNIASSGTLFTNGSFVVNSHALDAVDPTAQHIVVNGYNDASSLGYCPGIGFHIPGITYGTLKLNRSGEFTFINATLTGCMPIRASAFIKDGGTSSQFLKADGGVDSNTYLTTGEAASTYLPQSGGTISGSLSVTGGLSVSSNIYLSSSLTFGTSSSASGHLNASAGVLRWYDQSDWRTVYHSGNSNKRDVAWMASSLTLPNTGKIQWEYIEGTTENAPYITRESGSYSDTTRGDMTFSAGRWTSYDDLTAFKFVTSSAAYAMCIKNNGNVGIGTTAPTTALEVNGVIKAKGFQSQYLSIECNYSGSTYSGYGWEINNYGNPLYIQHSSVGNLYLCGGGGALFSYGVFSNYNMVKIYNSRSDTSYRLTLDNDGTSGAHIFDYNETTGEFGNIYLNYGGGYVSINTASNPGYSLYVAGSVVATGAITAGSASDSRLKENIKTISHDSARELIMALRPVTFKWNALATSLYDKYEGADLGFVAQEVEPLMPMAISTIFNDYKRLDQVKFIAPLVSVAQSHETRIRQLERENAELKRRLNMN